jgi:predicted DsbA family dithiol-disulfide isomerase
VAFPLHPETPEQGMGLEDLFAGRDVDLAAVRTRLKRAAEEVNLPLTDRNMTYNSRKATELGKWAEATGKGEAFHDAVFRAYFAEGLNIADIGVLKDICKGIGLDPQAAEKVVSQRTYATAVDEDWEYSLRIGISAVPSFLYQGRIMVGAQPFEMLEKLVNQAVLV